jgi:hypothetical protein
VEQNPFQALVSGAFRSRRGWLEELVTASRLVRRERENEIGRDEFTEVGDGK